MRAAPRALAPALAFATLAACGPPSSLPAPMGVRMRADTVYYDIGGVEPRAWSRALADARRTGGQSATAVTQWTTRWSYASTRRGSMGCDAVNPAVEAQVRFVMPRLLADTTTLAPEARAEWSRFLRSLWVHEEGHALRALRSAGAQLKTLQHLRTPSCPEFAMRARVEMDAVVERYRRENDEYQARTRGGMRQGAMLIVDRSRPLTVDTTYRDTLPP